MKQGQRLWSRDELILAVNLYIKLPFGKMHKGNTDVIHLAGLIDRTPSSIALKLGNFASFDPTLKERGIKGASNASKLDKQIWDEFYNNWDQALIQSESLLAKYKSTTIEQLNGIEIPSVEGLDVERTVKGRLNQHIFRKVVLATYDHKCCITGIAQPELLIASHILPWSKSNDNRMNPMNGLALNALHDRAFETGLITIDADSYNIIVSTSLLKETSIESVQDNFSNYHGKSILLPKKFRPDKEFLKYHNEHRFRA